MGDPTCPTLGHGCDQASWCATTDPVHRESIQLAFRSNSVVWRRSRPNLAPSSCAESASAFIASRALISEQQCWTEMAPVSQVPPCRFFFGSVGTKPLRDRTSFRRPSHLFSTPHWPRASSFPLPLGKGVSVVTLNSTSFNLLGTSLLGPASLFSSLAWSVRHLSIRFPAVAGEPKPNSCVACSVSCVFLGCASTTHRSDWPDDHRTLRNETQTPSHAVVLHRISLLPHFNGQGRSHRREFRFYRKRNYCFFLCFLGSRSHGLPWG